MPEIYLDVCSFAGNDIGVMINFCKWYKSLYLCNQSEMRRYKVRQVIDLLRADGWEIDRITGDHRQFVHKTKAGIVTVRGKLSDDLSQFLLNSIWKQAGWKQ